MYYFNAKNHFLLDYLLNDAEFNINDIDKKKNKGQISIIIRRPYWEAPKEKKRFFFKSTLVYEMKSCLEIKKVTRMDIKLKDEIFNDNKIQTIFGVQFNHIKKQLIIECEYLNITIFVNDDFTIFLKDTETNPNSNIFLNICGKPKSYFNIWKEKYDELQ